MSISYVGVDLRSSKFHQVAINHAGVSTHNRELVTSEANLIKAFSDLRGEIHVKQLYAMLDQSLASQTEAQSLMPRELIR